MKNTREERRTRLSRNGRIIEIVRTGVTDNFQPGRRNLAGSRSDIG